MPRRDSSTDTATDGRPTVARHGRLPRRGAARSVFALLGIALTVALVAGGSVVALAVWRLGTTVADNAIDITPEGQDPPAVGAIDGPVNLLLVGSDSGGGNAAYGPRGENLNDVTILIHISPESNSATAVTFGRDMFIDQPACDESGGFGPSRAATEVKMNTALSRGGLPCVVKTVAALTGLPIQYAGMIEFDGVVAMSNALGGVTVCVASPIKDRYTGLNLAAGEATLQGADALAFLRARHGIADNSDTARISNQQVFLSALIRQVKSAETLTNPVTMYALAAAAVDHMNLSTELASPNTMVSIALALKDIPLERIAFVQYPAGDTTVNGVSGTLPRKTPAKVLIDAIADDKAVSVGTLGGAAVENPSTPTAPDPTATTDPSAPATSSPSTDPNAPVVLPDGVTGQSAAQQTCTKGGG